ncbi:ATP-binding cassette domain-containing protein, partial [Nocardia carnea]|uniref:ATP-binding cassette domain-containing protein n=1 Tax=Nocardia carnea TaxID=37328 RepID=UPI003D784030
MALAAAPGNRQGDVTPASIKEALRTEDLTVRFGGLTALDAVSFEIRRGEILGLIGPNGAGKSTTIRAVLGMIRPSAGRVRIFGDDAADVRSAH